MEIQNQRINPYPPTDIFCSLWKKSCQSKPLRNILIAKVIQPILSLFNINFDFNHSIKGHSIRIIKGEEGVNLFDLRIDNRSFDYLMKKKKIYEEE